MEGGVVYQAPADANNLFSLDSEAWDDTALIDAWDKQVEMYIKTRGGRKKGARKAGKLHGDAKSQGVEAASRARESIQPVKSEAKKDVIKETEAADVEGFAAGGSRGGEQKSRPSVAAAPPKTRAAVCIADCKAGTNGQIRVRAGTRVQILADCGEWSWVRDPSGVVGLVARANIKPLSGNTIRQAPQTPPHPAFAETSQPQYPSTPQSTPRPMRDGRGFSPRGAGLPPFPQRPSPQYSPQYGPQYGQQYQQHYDPNSSYYSSYYHRGHAPSASFTSGMPPGGVRPPPPMFGYPGGGIPLPSAPTQDKALAELLMSWYYMGYQTGRYKALREAYGWP